MAHSRTQHWAMAPPYHNRGSPPQQEQAGPAAEDESGAGSVGNQPRSLWIGGLLNWMDEEYLYRCFTRSSELVSVVVKHNKETRQPEGFGYLNFADHATADQILQSYNGQKMPNTDRDFRLSWVIRSAPEKPAGDDHAIYVGDLSLDVTDFMLHDVFKNRYPSVKKATVIWDGFSGHSKGYGASAEEARRILNGSQLGNNTMRIFWARRLSNKKDEANDEYHGHPQGSGPDYGCSPGDPNMHGYKGRGGYAYHQQKQPQQTPVQVGFISDEDQGELFFPSKFSYFL
ncbi:hypothetical protein ACQ4PT_002663 [Festuca glaucescens]